MACDGLKGLPDAIAEVWPLATVQNCGVHLVRASLRYAPGAHWSRITNTRVAVRFDEACLGCCRPRLWPRGWTWPG